MKRKEKRQRSLIILLVFFLYQLLIFGSGYSYMFDPKGDWRYTSIAGFFLSIIGGILLYRILKQNENQEILERELQEAEHSQRLLKSHNHNALLYHEQVEQMKIGMKMVLKGIETELHKEDDVNIGSTFSKIEKSVYDKRKIYCNNLIVQAVLEEKQIECEKNGFKMEIDVSIGEAKGISKIHLCSIFSNLLDNAISASLNVEKTKRRIMVKAGIKAEYLIIEVINLFSVSHVNQLPSPGRGYGKQILADIAQQYEGYYEAEMKGNLYKAVVILRMGK